MGEVRKIHFAIRERILDVVEVMEKEMWHRSRRKHKTQRDRYSYVEVGNKYLVPIDGLLLGANKLGKRKRVVGMFNTLRILIDQRPLGINPHVDGQGRIAYLAIPWEVVKEIKEYYPSTFKGEKR